MFLENKNTQNFIYDKIKRGISKNPTSYSTLSYDVIATILMTSPNDCWIRFRGKRHQGRPCCGYAKFRHHGATVNDCRTVCWICVKQIEVQQDVFK